MTLLETSISDEQWEACFEIRSDVLKSLEEARATKVIGKSLEAHVHLSLSDAQRALLTNAIGDESALAQWLIVSKLSLVSDAPQYEVCGVSVHKADGVSCPRCWTVTQSVHEDHLCDRCHTIINA